MAWLLRHAAPRTPSLSTPHPTTPNTDNIQVFHGAESDIKWLQRDFSLYVVNLFDTFLAAKQLRPPPAAFSLAYLLQVRGLL